MNSVPQKQCNRCGRSFPATPEYFRIDSRNKNGISNPCRVCKLLESREYFQRSDIQEKERSRKNSPEYKEKQKSHRNTPEYLASQREYAKTPAQRARVKRYKQDPKNKKRASEKRKTPKFRAKKRADQRQRRLNPIIKQKEKDYRQRPEVKENYLEHTQRRRSLQRLLPYTMTVQDKQRAVEYFDGCCPVCGRQFSDLFSDRTLSWDHWWVAQSKGGAFTSDNILPLCHGFDGCNNSKHNRTPEEWLNERYGKRKARQILERIKAYFKRLE